MFTVEFFYSRDLLYFPRFYLYCVGILVTCLGEQEFSLYPGVAQMNLGGLQQYS